MRTIETTVFQYSELSETAKERARDWYRVGMVTSDFSAEYVLDDSKEILRALGFRTPDIYYSGFSSQGDGACFAGGYYANASDLQKLNAIVQDRPTDKDLHKVLEGFAALRAARPHMSATVSVRRGNNMVFDVSAVGEDMEDEWGPGATDAEYEETFKELCRDFANWIYRTLEREYEYQNSDECVAESIEANEYEFTEDGDRA